MLTKTLEKLGSSGSVFSSILASVLLFGAAGFIACGGDPVTYLPPLNGGQIYTYTSDVPCDVDTVLRTNCTSCHGSPPAAAPIPLVSRQDLIATSTTDPTKKVIERAVLRMQGTPTPMPPGPAVTASAADIATLQGWIAAGEPAGSCTVTGTATCQSGQTWTRGGGTSLMNPGMACIYCHSSSGDGPIFQIAGTVYPSLHEADKCLSSVGTSVSVVITDAAGTTVTLPVNSSGNFSYGGSSKIAKLKLPYSAKVVSGSKTRAMSSTQTSGDCNGCHTVGGTSGAPGRILAP